MNDLELLAKLSETDAYAPGAAVPTRALSRDAALSVIERRMGMDTQEPKTTRTEASPAVPPTAHRSDRTKETRTVRGRRGFAVAAAAFGVVAVVAVALGVIFATQDRDAPPVDEGPEQVATTFVQGLEQLDASSIDGLVSPVATTMYLNKFGYTVEKPGTIEGLWAWGALYGQSYSFDGCRESDDQGGPPQADGSGPYFTCDYQLENDWTRALGQAPMSGRFRLKVTDGQVVWLVEDFPFDEFEAAWGGVIDWVQANHPDDFTTMFLEPPGSAKLTPESLALWEVYTPQIVEALRG